MAFPSHVAVVDFGKTNIKLAIVDLEAEIEVAERRMPNEVRRDGPFPHYDTEQHWRFLLDALTELGADWPIGAIAITTHGATAALVDEAGGLVLPILDYEHPLPATGYDALRPDFAVTGSPRLGAGLNLGAQLHWLFTAFPEARERTAHIVTYPEYWAMRLCGVPAIEATSLGCHTDLWAPWDRDFSPLVDAMGWRRLMPAPRRAGEPLGPIRLEIAAQTGLAPGLPVLCGIHDSNASLHAHLRRRPAPFSVISTGTWVVAMAIGAAPRPLDPDRDLLVNVNAFGEPTPSARFMGGREYEIIRAGRDFAPTDRDRERVIAHRLMLLPAVEPDFGPFRGREGGWTASPGGPGEEAVALAFYLALTTAEALDLLGAAGPTLVEGPFARNAAYLDMLEAATGRPALAASGGATGTAVGAALLARAAAPPRAEEAPPPRRTDHLAAYATEWQARVRAGELPRAAFQTGAATTG